ncbi:hypothetical protein NBO_80g0008 [Nosema bombycis CQ1]|uniref:Uncharacterized protein n=1 Tax=Nosema bombycis (strain CQ1 / CVCC 102059) TaxID=578461 RepID=R0M5T7_NOSB1|nr:hypothetical protein NBO_80g0008 [Nosema bombycis CQ1]|eukprot:EOB13344.1 hypothetical protein NBO_80g0008 [Nosema bombycis CQ1]
MIQFKILIFLFPKMKSFLKSRKDKKPKQAEENDELEFLKWQIRDINRKIRDFGREVDKFIIESERQG